METKAEYANKLDAQIRLWDSQIAVWSAIADKANTTVRIEYEYELDSLRSKRAVAHGRLSKLARCGDDSWDELENSTQRVWIWMDMAMERASARFV